MEIRDQSIGYNATFTFNHGYHIFKQLLRYCATVKFDYTRGNLGSQALVFLKFSDEMNCMIFCLYGMPKLKCSVL